MTMLKPLLWILPLLILGAVLKSPWFKGQIGEHRVRRIVARRLDPSIYREFSDVTILAGDGTTQIDHIYVSRFGLFVIETKNMSGWIFGSTNQPYWTQTIYRSKFKFQNPLRQNYRHIKALESLLDLPSGAFKSVIVFTGDCTFKTEMPDEVCTCSDLIEYIRSIDTPILSEDQVAQACDRIRTMRMEQSWRTHRNHVDSLRRRHGAGVSPRTAVGVPVPAFQRNSPSSDSPSPIATKARLSASGGKGRDWDLGPLIFGAAVLLALMVSCVRFTSGRSDTAKASVRQPAPARSVVPSAPVAKHQSRLIPAATTRTEALRLRKQTPEEAREAKQRADEAMRVIEATTPEM